MSNLKKYKSNICKNNISIRKALILLNIIKLKCLIVVDVKKRLIGTLTDGDIRRSLLLGAKFNDGINKHVYRNSFYINKSELTKNKNFNIPEDISLIPIINSKRKIIDLIRNNKFKNYRISSSSLNAQVIIMAGGLGTRLRPFSSIIPKPLIPIEGKPIIEHIMDKFIQNDFKKFTISVNINQKIIKAFFKTNKTKYELNYISEKKTLGTVGSLSLVNNISKDFFVINCDSILDFNYKSALEYHQKNKNDLTVVVAKKKIEIPYGVFELDKYDKIQIIEKPSKEILINTGMYIFSKKVLTFLKKNKKIDMDELIKKLIHKKSKVDLFPIENTSWYDFGQLNSFFQNKGNLIKFKK